MIPVRPNYGARTPCCPMPSVNRSVARPPPCPWAQASGNVMRSVDICRSPCKSHVSTLVSIPQVRSPFGVGSGTARRYLHPSLQTHRGAAHSIFNCDKTPNLERLLFLFRPTTHYVYLSPLTDVSWFHFPSSQRLLHLRGKYADSLKHDHWPLAACRTLSSGTFSSF
jgi:hypothetical protein